jgi:hypothetical protein
VSVDELPALIGDAFDLIGNIIKPSRADQKLLAAAKKAWVRELDLRALLSQEHRPRL